jgi:Uma2 family endonuclease
MLAHRERRRFTPAEYLALEENSATKSEYYRGDIYAMSGASVEHNQLVRNLTAKLDPALQGSPCQLFVSGLRLHVVAHDLFTYPDLFAVCGPLARLSGRNDTLTDASFVIEVLSPSTESYDRGQKFLFYQGLPSFREYLLVSQDSQKVELHTLQRPGQWLSTQFTEGEIQIESVGARLQLAEIYRDVELPG